MASERIKRGFYRVCTDAANKIFDRYAFWTTADQVETQSGKKLEDTVGSIEGITNSRNVTEPNYALDARFASEISHIQEFQIFQIGQSSPTQYQSEWTASGNTNYPFMAVFNTDLYDVSSSPDWCLKTASTFPTADEKTANALIQIMEIKDTEISGQIVRQVIFYASAKPSIDVTIQVKGL